MSRCGLNLTSKSFDVEYRKKLSLAVKPRIFSLNWKQEFGRPSIVAN
jgi:hypothetical protein